MPRHAILFLGIVLCCTAAAAQVVVVPHEAAPTFNPETKKALPTSAELALDAAKRWTQAGLDDSSNLQPLERDFFLARLAAIWNKTDHARAEEYLKTSLEKIKADAVPNPNPDNVDGSGMLTMISSEVLAVDRNAWNNLIESLPPYAASETISLEAGNVVFEDPAEAMQLERESLKHGGSEQDPAVLYNLIAQHQDYASTLFDEMLSTASKPDSDSNLLTMLTQDAFNERDDETIKPFFNQDRQQRLLDLLAQRTLAGQQNGGCNYSWETARLISRFPASLQGQLQPVIAQCENLHPTNAAVDQVAENKPSTTDALVRAMNEASDVKVKIVRRQRAADHAAQIDHDYERAVRLCLEASEEERAQSHTSIDRFDNSASNYSYQGIRSAMAKQDEAEMQRILDLLPARLKPQVELNAARLLAKKDRVHALQMLADAQNILEHELPLRSVVYRSMLQQTADLTPSDINLAWRILVTGLNHFDQTQRVKNQSKRLPAEGDAGVYEVYPWSIPTRAVEDESLVRASIEDLTLPQYRACLRLGVIEAFLTRYSDALKEAPKQTNSITAVKN